MSDAEVERFKKHVAAIHRRFAEAEPRKSPPYLDDVPNHAIDMEWEDRAYRGDQAQELVNKVKVSRTGVWWGPILVACQLKITYTAPNAGQINRIRLLYTPAWGEDVVLDDASEASGRIGSTAEFGIVEGTVPATAKAVKLLWTGDSGPEQTVQRWTIRP